MANNGTIAGTITFSPGKFGNAAGGFSATNTINLPDLSTALTTSFTATFLVKTPAPSSTQVFLAMGGNAGGAYSWIAVSSNGHLMVEGFTGGGVDTGLIVGDNSWHYVEVVYTPSAVTAYVDRVASTVTTIGAGGPMTGTYAIGSFGAGSYPFTAGLIEQVAFFTGNRYAAESGIPSAAYTGAEPNLVALYALNANANDSAGSAPAPSVTVAVSPTSFPLGVVTTLTLTGTGTAWTSSTKPTVSGGVGAYLSNVAVNGQVITATLWPGTATGSLTLGDTMDAATVAATASPATVSTSVVFFGDSLTAGLNGTGYGSVNATRLQTVINGLGPSAAASQQGISGQPLTQMISNAGNIASLYQSGKANYLVIQGGHNDINTGASAATVITRIQTLIATILAGQPGWKIVWATELPAGTTGGFPASFDAARDAVNLFMRANWRALGLYALSDVAADALMGQDGQAYNTTYYSSSDAIHLTDAGYVRWGMYDLAAILNGTSASATTLFF